MSAVRVRLSPARELSGYYDSTEFCQFGSSIYDFAFMDVDKILPFSSTLGWHSLNVNGEVQKRKGLRWIPRHPETRKGVASDEMLAFGASCSIVMPETLPAGGPQAGCAGRRRDGVL